MKIFKIPVSFAVKTILEAGVVWAAVLSACAVPARHTMPLSTVHSASGIAAEAGFVQAMASRTIDGHALSRDSRPIAMVFFASWCSNCRRELAELGRLRERYPRVRVIGLNAYEEYQNFSDRQRLRAYVEANAPWLDEIVSADEALRATFGTIPKIPSLFIFRSSGRLVAEFRRNRGEVPSPQQLEQALQQAMSDG